MGTKIGAATRLRDSRGKFKNGSILSLAQKKARNRQTKKRYNKKWIASGRSKQYQRELRKFLRNSVLDLLGRSCRRCGFNDERALQVDHVNGGGRQESLKGQLTMYRKIIMNPAGYQTLCANCNWIKRAEQGEGNDTN